MDLLKSDFLLEAYHSAIEQQLDPLFIELLQHEIEKRGLELKVRKVS